jgi:hypothetical protein
MSRCTWYRFMWPSLNCSETCAGTMLFCRYPGCLHQYDTLYIITWKSLSVNWSRSVVFFEYSVSQSINMILCTTSPDKACQWLAADWWVSEDTLVFPSPLIGYSIQHHMIKFVSDLQQIGGFLRILWFLSPIGCSI